MANEVEALDTGVKSHSRTASRSGPCTITEQYKSGYRQNQQKTKDIMDQVPFKVKEADDKI
jgi:hypothetical protein